MSRTVFCQHLNKEADGLDFQLYPGELGKKTVSYTHLTLPTKRIV